MSSGTSVMWPAAWLEIPTMCTSFSIASRAASAGVWNSGPMSTSKPRSANAVAITLAPRSCPSWPNFATRMRGRRPSAFANVSTALAHPLQLVGAVVRAAVHARDATDHRAVAGEDALERVGDLADRRPRARRFDRELEQVGVARGALGERVERGLDASGVAVGAQRLEPRDLLAAHFGVVDVAHVDRGRRRSCGTC